MHKIRQGFYDLSRQPGEPDYTAKLVPGGLGIEARGPTRADALKALAIEMRLIADGLDEEARKPR